MPASARKRPSSVKTKQNNAASATAIESTKEEQVQQRASSSRVRHSAQVNGLREQVTNLSPEITSFNDGEQNKSVVNNYNKEIKENEISDEDKVLQQSAEKSDQPASEFTEPQVDNTETT